MGASASIARVMGAEVLDSRGNPTVQVTVVLDDGSLASATVPSGASTGDAEAVELRDGDRRRYGGKGVLNAVRHVNELIGPALTGLLADDQWRIDAVLIELDGTDSKSRLGANATLGASLACARVAAQACHLPLCRYLGGDAAHILPTPMLNVLDGGIHGNGGPDLQEFMLVPLGAPTFREALRYGVETYHALRELLVERRTVTNVGDEGGFVPVLSSNGAALDLMMQAIERAGYRPGEDISLALDFAATSLWHDGRYRLEREGRSLSAQEMTGLCREWGERYPLVSVEDPLMDNDWDGYAELTRELGDRMQIAGDDLFVSNRSFLVKGIAQRCCNCVVIKPNQVGTVTETLNTARMALAAGYSCMVAHRSGETEDTSIADLAVALNCGQIKAGAPARGERVAKYNRLLTIEGSLGEGAHFAGRAAFQRKR
ncbi:Enolase [Paraburkholderia caffeinitolerans]|uniref:Enolase n=1 Tax=Paraburkholderia caffeinitolerans TaxID=1723730 RepID=A0A6J5GBX4_9BURK|nr:MULTISPECIES: phosphopyruvate hydratase [Paraburkholderia]CAB3793670.1 Enolase [Paraburkholderia caffeinitolerans]